MDAKLIAKILPYKKDGKRTIGTGYPIGKDLVLTARHVLFPHWDDTGKVDVVWGDLNHSTSVIEVVFDGGEACDVAVIRCQTPPQAHVAVWILGQNAPNLNSRWDSLGYSHLGKDENTGSRVLVSALGEFHHHNGTHIINLTSKSDAKDKDDWKGLSGAPVFQGNTLYAVITETPKNRDECFAAVYVPWLLEQNQNFRAAVGFDDNAVNCQQFLNEQKCQILEHLQSIQHGKLFKQLIIKLRAVVATSTPNTVSEQLLTAFEGNCLNVFDLLLQASSDALEQDHSPEVLDSVRILFCLFASLMASTSLIAREAFIHLSVYSKMATELHLAPLYNTNPHFTMTKDGEVVGKYAIDASEFTREVGWEVDGFKKEALNIVYSGVCKKSLPKQFNAFERKKLNTMIKQRQNKSLNQLHRFELNCCDKTVINNPLHDAVYCQALNEKDCLPDLPIVHFGEVEATQEAELSAKIDELFEILHEYGYTP